MDTNTLKIILQNKISGLEQVKNIASQMGNIEEVMRLDVEIEETRTTLNAL